MFYGVRVQPAGCTEQRYEKLRVAGPCYAESFDTRRTKTGEILAQGLSRSCFDLAARYASLEARMCRGCSHGFEVDISICHLQVSQSVATRSAPDASICRNSGSPMACDVA